MPSQWDQAPAFEVVTSVARWSSKDDEDEEEEREEDKKLEPACIRRLGA